MIGEVERTFLKLLHAEQLNPESPLPDESTERIFELLDMAEDRRDSEIRSWNDGTISEEEMLRSTNRLAGVTLYLHARLAKMPVSA